MPDWQDALRRNPPRTVLGSAATAAGPAPGPEDPSQQNLAPQMGAGAQAMQGAVEGATDPNRIMRTGAALVGGAAGAALAPETAVGMAFRWAPQLIRTGVQLLTRGAGAGVGQGVAGEITHPSGETPEEKTQRRVTDFASGVAGEVAGAGVIKGFELGARALRSGAPRLSQFLSAMRERLRPTNPLQPGAVEAADVIRPFGGYMLPGQMSRSPIVDTTQNILDSAFTSMGVMGRAGARAEKSALAALNTASRKIALVAQPKTAGQLVEYLVKNPLEAQKMTVRSAYNNLDTEIAKVHAGGGPILPGQLAGSVDLTPALRSFESRFAVRIAKGNATALRIQSYLDNPRPLTFKEADEIRGMLLDEYRSASPEVSPGLKAYAGKVAHDVDQLIIHAANNAGSLGQGVRSAMEAAREARSMQAKFFNEELIGPLLEKAAPEQVAEAFFADANPSQIESLRKIVFEPEFRKAIGGDPQVYWEKIQSHWITQKRLAAGEGAYGVVGGKALGDAIDNSGGTFEALYPNPKQQKAVRDSARALELIQSRPGGSRSGSVLVQMTQGREVGNSLAQLGNVLSIGGAGYTYGKTGDYKKSLLILVSPYFAAKVFSSRAFSSWLMQRALFRETRLGTLSTSVMGQAAAALIKDQIPFILYDPTTDTPTVYDPSKGTSGPHAPTKPQSKLQNPNNPIVVTPNQ